MAKCTACGFENSESGNFCGGCGRALAPSSRRPTLPIERTASDPSRATADSYDEGRFLPGQLLADRYRIIALIGRGGMGEVYRATDLVLGQPVALKFLPESTTLDEGVRARFFGEVRVARQVSHPNVCRVYDIGSINGQPYISMEYVDGEDLGLLLRRIGRLPAEKALEIARQLCAGLAAAHQKGVLHRDLKPSNIMINGRGEVVITDFGLAGVAEQIEAADIRNGTPAYMAPEQLAGKEVSVKSDIYTLGLVLYEIFTGRRAFEARSRAEMARLQTEGPPSPASVVRDLNPAVERVMLRCLATEARHRPASAMAVAAALPGGDPLTAAVERGQTPSPEMVAAAGAEEGTRPRAAVLWLAGAAAGLLLWAWIAPQANLLGNVPMENSPETLKLKALDVLKRFGYDGPYLDSAVGLAYSAEYARYLDTTPRGSARQPLAEEHGNTRSAMRWKDLHKDQPALVRFWYRQSPQYLIASDFLNPMVPGVVTLTDPPRSTAGMADLELDLHARLISFDAIPAQHDTPQRAPPSPDWNDVFAAAGLSPGSFKPVDPEWAPVSACDVRAAWTGTYPDAPDVPLRIEAAAWRGRPVHFQMIVGAHDAAVRPQPASPTPGNSTAGEVAGNVVYISVVLAIIVTAILLARKNTRLGRGDPRGAWRVAAFLFALTVLLWLIAANHVPSLDEFRLAWIGISAAISISALLWVFYVALEPYVRRRWPQTLIGWSRLLAGSLRDPLVGRDVLIGTVYGIAGSGLFLLVEIVKQRFGSPPAMFPYLNSMLGGSFRIAVVLVDIRAALLIAFSVLLLMVLLRSLLRSQWAAAAFCIFIFTALDVLRSHHPVVEGSLSPLAYMLSVYLLLRYGLLAFVTGVAVNGMLFDFPLTLNFGAWYAGEGIFAMIAILLIAVYGFYSSLGGQPLLHDEL